MDLFYIIVFYSSGSTILDVPKSVNLIVPSWSTKIFAAFKSLCNTFFSCKYLTPSKIYLVYYRIIGSSSLTRSSTFLNDPYAIYSNAISTC